MPELTVKETIKNLLDRHIKDIELHDALALSGNVTRDDLLVFQNQDASFVNELDMSGLQVNDCDLEPLSHLHLTTLRLNDNKDLRDLHAIKSMNKLRYLQASGCAVTGAGIAVISQLGDLEELDLSQTPIRDRDLVTLYRLSRLKQFDLGGCPNLSLAAVKLYRSNLPNCDVRFKLPIGACSPRQNTH
jgi:hypothetical protein